MNFEAMIVGGVVGVAAGWLFRRWRAALRRRRDGACAGGCGCGPKPKR
jgi:hypothetical protein